MKDIELLRSQETERLDELDLRISNALELSDRIEASLNSIEQKSSLDSIER